MSSNSGLVSASCSNVRVVGGIAVILALGLSSAVASAQDNWDRNRNMFTRLEPGMTISVRPNAPIDAARTDYRVYTGIVDQDVRGADGRLAIPRGSTAELMVRRPQNNELILDLESVMVNGQRYAVRTDPNRIVGTAGSDSLIGSIVGAITGGQIRGQAVRIPRNTVMNFRLERPLDVGVPDRGVMRDGYHYHDYYGRETTDDGINRRATDQSTSEVRRRLLFRAGEVPPRSNPVVCETRPIGLRGLAVLELEQAAESRTARDRACADRRGLGRDEFVAQTLVRPLLMMYP